VERTLSHPRETLECCCYCRGCKRSCRCYCRTSRAAALQTQHSTNWIWNLYAREQARAIAMIRLEHSEKVLMPFLPQSPGETLYRIKRACLRMGRMPEENIGVRMLGAEELTEDSAAGFPFQAAGRTIMASIHVAPRTRAPALIPAALRLKLCSWYSKSGTLCKAGWLIR
jgi:hypothetical protein